MGQVAVPGCTEPREQLGLCSCMCSAGWPGNGSGGEEGRSGMERREKGWRMREIFRSASSSMHKSPSGLLFRVLVPQLVLYNCP